MGLFGSDKTYTTTILTQEDKSVQTAGDAKNVLGTGASLAEAQPYSVITGPNTRLGDIVFNQFPEAVRDTVSDLIHSVETAVTQSSASQVAATEAIGQKLSDIQVGEAAMLPKIILYLAIGGVALFLGMKALR